MEEILTLIRKALGADRDTVDSFSDIDGEAGVIGVSLIDGREVFVKVEPA